MVTCFFAETSVLSDVDYVLCLDSIGKTDNLFLHVSKPPKEGTPAFALVEVQYLGHVPPVLNCNKLLFQDCSHH